MILIDVCPRVLLRLLFLRRHGFGWCRTRSGERKVMLRMLLLTVTGVSLWGQPSVYAYLGMILRCSMLPLCRCPSTSCRWTCPLVLYSCVCLSRLPT